MDGTAIAFRNPHQGKRELESGLPYRLGGEAVDRRIPRHTPQLRLECCEGVGDIPAFHATNRLGGGFRGALRRRIQFKRRIAWRRSAGGAKRHRIEIFCEDEHRSQLWMGRRSHHRATRLGKSHAAGDGHYLLETVDYLPRRQSSDQRHRPVRVPPRLPSQRVAGDVGDASEVDWSGWLDASGPLPHLEISDSDGASERG